MRKFYLEFNILLLLTLQWLTTQGKVLVHATLHRNVTNSTTASPWLRRMTNPRATGCMFRPWICNQDFPRIRQLCCRNRCTDVTSDVNNCGLCGIRCPFSLQCCRGICVNTNLNPFHCGRCSHRCPFPGFCFFGICNYAQPLPPIPFPFPPLPPFPPRPFPPKPFPPPKGCPPGDREHPGQGVEACI